jgi:hypothetical protein
MYIGWNDSVIKSMTSYGFIACPAPVNCDRTIHGLASLDFACFFTPGPGVIDIIVTVVINRTSRRGRHVTLKPRSAKD